MDAPDSFIVAIPKAPAIARSIIQGNSLKVATVP